MDDHKTLLLDIVMSGYGPHRPASKSVLIHGSGRVLPWLIVGTKHTIEKKLEQFFWETFGVRAAMPKYFSLVFNGHPGEARRFYVPFTVDAEHMGYFENDEHHWEELNLAAQRLESSVVGGLLNIYQTEGENAFSLIPLSRHISVSERDVISEETATAAA